MRRLCTRKTLTLLSAVLGLSALPVSQAATKTWDFNTDPSGDVLLEGVAVWHDTGGVTGGYVSLTDAAGSLSGTATFPNVDSGGQSTGFDMKVDIRIGGGSARPADGVSINWVTDGTAAGGVGEEGLGAGVVISLDTWDNNGGDTAPSIEAKLNQAILRTAYSFGQREGGRAFGGTPTFDIQTGAAFVPLHVNYKNSFISVDYKGVNLFSGVYAPATSDIHGLIFGARTGGANENHWIDNLVLTTYDTTVNWVSRVNPDPTPPQGNEAPSTANIEVDINDSTVAPLNNSTVVMKVDGTVVTPTFPKTGTTTTVTFNPPGDMLPGSHHTVEVTFGTGVGTTTDKINYEFTVGPLTSDAVFIETEDVNYDSGKYIADANVGQYPGGAYAGLGMVHKVDYFRTDGAGNDEYRLGEDPNMAMVQTPDPVRAGWTMTTNYKVGWNDPGEWANYTRVFPAKSYKVYGRFASGGGPNRLSMEIIGNANVENQIVIKTGNFNAEASGGWDTFKFVPLTDAAGNPVIINMSGEETVRLTTENGGNNDNNYLAFVPTAATITTAYAVVVPDQGGVVDPTTSFTITGALLDQSVPITASSVSMKVNGVAVTETATKVGGITSVVHTEPAGGFGKEYTVVLTYTESGTVKTKTVVFHAGGGVTRRVFSDISGTAVSDLTGNDKYLQNAPDEETVEPLYETLLNVANNYGVELLGYFQPPVTADYTFEISADDNAILYLSTDDQPYHKVAIARQNGWNASRNWTGDDGGGVAALVPRTSAPIHLIGGQKYFTQAIMKEGGGGDNLSVAARKPGDAPLVNGDAPASFEMRPFPGVGFDVIPKTATINQGVPIILTAKAIAGPGGPITYQWFKGAVAIAGATSDTLDLGPAAPGAGGNSGTYTVVATVTPTAGGAPVSGTSPAAVITVTIDTTPPKIASVKVRDLADIAVTFDEPLPAALASVFSLSGGATVKDVSPGATLSTYILHTSILTDGTTYTVTATGATDYAGNAGNSTKSFLVKLTQGYAHIQTYSGIGGGAVTDLTASPRFPDSPTTDRYGVGFEGPTNTEDNYGTRLTGYFIAPKNGNVVWFISTDDGGALYMSTDEDPANKHQIAAETSWSDPRNWAVSDNTGADLTAKRSDQWTGSEWPTPNVITVVGGKKYYMELLQKEGGGGDCSGATFKYDADADPANGTLAFTGSALAVIADPVITITAPLTGAEFTAGATVNLTVDVLSSVGAAKVEYFANGTLIGATTTAPFSASVPSVPAGLYTVTAKITDVSGGTFTSGPIYATVRPAAGAKKLLFARANGTISPFASDVAIINHLFAKGYDVYDTGAAAGSLALAGGKDAVIVSSTAGSGDSNSKYRPFTGGVLTWENNIEDDMLFTLNGATDHNVTTATGVTITAAGAAHPIFAGFAAGDLALFTSAQSMAWGTPATSAKILGGVIGNPSNYTPYVFETGDVLINGTDTAQGRRVLFPLDDNSWNAITADGIKVFDQAVAWIIGGTVTPPKATLTVTKSGTDITISWTNGGHLESTTSLDKPTTWTAAGASSPVGPISTTSGVKYYRVVNP